MNNEKYPKISVIFVTYDRLVTLRPTLESFIGNTDYPRDKLELIVADDCSPKKVQEEIEGLPFDLFCLGDKRLGLGANVNRGLRAASGDYILQLQDDWRCIGSNDYLKKAIGIISEEASIGSVLLRHHRNRSTLKQSLKNINACRVRIYGNDPSSRVESVNSHAYSDWPHLKRKEFVDDVGLYLERAPMWEAELDYSNKVNSQVRWMIADSPDIDAFIHIGNEFSYNWPWRKRVSNLICKLPKGDELLKIIRKARK